MEINLDPFNKLGREISKLCPTLKTQMEAVDLDETSFLREIIVNLKKLDTNEIGNVLTHNSDVLIEIIEKLDHKGEISAKDGLIFNIRAKEKRISNNKPLKKIQESIDQETKSRRLSFANTKFCDAGLILKTEDLREMTNLNFIFSLNGYHLPLCESNNQRGMYEHFFSEFLKEYELKFTLSNQYQLLQESVMILYIVSEMIVDIIEVIFEIFEIINTRIKSCSVLLDMAKIRRFNEIQDEVLSFLLEEFKNSKRLYKTFATKKILKMQSQRDDITNSWTTKINVYSENIKNTLEKHVYICDLFTAKINELKNREFLDEDKKPVKNSNEYKRLCSDVFLYIQSYTNFVNESVKSQSKLNSTLKASYDLMYYIDGVEESLSDYKSPRSPVKPKTARGGFWNLFSSRKSTVPN